MSLLTIKSGIIQVVKTTARNMLASRSFDTAYQNDAYVRNVQISILLSITAAAGDIEIDFYTSAVPDPYEWVATGEIGISKVIRSDILMLIGIVQPRHYYTLISSAANATGSIERWWEINFN